jgi:hypothetical protein
VLLVLLRWPGLLKLAPLHTLKPEEPLPSLIPQPPLEPLTPQPPLPLRGEGEQEGRPESQHGRCPSPSPSPLWGEGRRDQGC